MLRNNVSSYPAVGEYLWNTSGEKVKKQWSAVQFDGGATVNGRWTSAGHFTDTVTPVLKAW